MVEFRSACRRIVLFAAVLCSLTCHSRAQEPDAANLLGQTKDSGSMPLWSTPTAGAIKELGRVARNIERGVFLVGFPKVGTGTAWVISARHRLLVTNAHVADIYFAAGNQLVAIPSGTAQIYTVEKIWYHPGVRRFLKDNPSLSVRSSDPKEGEVDSYSPDLAILQLAAGGPDLTVEFPLATSDDLAELFAQPAAIIGYPGHDTASWPALGEKAASTFHEGVISRVTDFELGTSVPYEEQQFVQYTMATWPGFSGSPVFLPSGRVAAVHNMARPAEGRYKQIITIPHGVRADCVLELLVHHGLEGMVPFEIDKSKVRVERWTKPDPRSEEARANYAKALELVSEAEDLVYNKSQYKAGSDKCNEALKLIPNFAPAYYVRSNAFNNYFVDHEGSQEDNIKLLSVAHEDAVKYAKLVPSDFAGIIHVCRVLNNLGMATENYENNRKALVILNEVLTSKDLSTYQRAQAHSSRGSALSHLGESDAALREHNEAIRLSPQSGIFLWNRSYYWRGRGRYDLEAADVARAKELDARPSAAVAADLAKAQKQGQTIVLVEWKGKWYQAAIVMTNADKSLIHYLGYDDSWNEWVTSDRIKPTK